MIHVVQAILEDTPIEINEEVAQQIIPVDMGAFQTFLSEFPQKAINFGVKLIIAIIILIVGGYLIKLIRKLVKKSLMKAKAEHGVIAFLDSFIKILLFVILFVLIASYFGFSIAGLITILGSLGVAIGLAMKDNLSNIAAGVIMLFTKPFRMGDYIVLTGKGVEGTVEDISIFSTRLCTFDGNTVIVPNGQLIQNSLTNFSTNPTRRVDLTVGISYASDIAKAKGVILSVIKSDEALLSDKPIDVFVNNLADSAVEIGIHFYVNNSNFWGAKWRVLENVKTSLDANGVQIPFPQVDVHIEK